MEVTHTVVVQNFRTTTVFVTTGIPNPKTTDSWELNDGCFEPVMFEGPQIPDELLTDDVNVTNADDKESDNDIEDDQTSSESGSDEDIAYDFL